tara:strand:- start:479 stop:673 length:195 start_codon:yes stop_codon:yes gene_type:complete
LTHTETAKITVESSYKKKDDFTLQKHTTSDGCNGLIMIQNMVSDEDKYTKAEILCEAIKSDLLE